MFETIPAHKRSRHDHGMPWSGLWHTDRDRHQGPSQTNIQATVENPAIHFLLLQDQAAIVQDRIECLQSPIVTVLR